MEQKDNFKSSFSPFSSLFRPPSLLLFGRIFLGLIFAYAGFSKLMEPVENFRGAVAQYEVIPYALTPVIAAVLPWFEFVFGSFMILGFATRLAVFVLGALSLGFLLVLGSSHVLLGASPLSCGCFGANSPIHLTVRQVFLLDLVDLFLAFKLYSQKSHSFSLDALLKK